MVNTLYAFWPFQDIQTGAQKRQSIIGFSGKKNFRYGVGVGRHHVSLVYSLFGAVTPFNKSEGLKYWHRLLLQPVVYTHVVVRTIKVIVGGGGA